ncbi:hypothetical protein JKP88DRAFT_306506 [Tribonema minus]|uniref:Pentatricopeptide repeat-containing protein n=1 Tax=Tribonema minus TaxID=303371 RepID=A0A836CIY5_9STRA|nr:hypothetical protein JKP88DRAFT_306506 [Tribonema minus]
MNFSRDTTQTHTKRCYAHSPSRARRASYNLAQRVAFWRRRTSLALQRALTRVKIDNWNAVIAPDGDEEHLRLQQAKERVMKGSEAGSAVMEAATAAAAAASVQALSPTRAMSAALIMMSLLRRSGTPPDRGAYTYADRALGGAQSAQKADQLLQEMADAGLTPDEDAFVAALLAYGHSRSWQRALDLFAETEATHPHLLTVDAWNQLLAVLNYSNELERAVAKAAEMVERGLALDAETYAQLLGAYALLADDAKLEALAAGMRAAGVPLTAACRYCGVRGYALGGHLQRAEDAFEAAVASGDADPKMVKAMLRGCRRARDAQRAERWLRRALSLGLAPTASAWHLAVETAHEAGDADAADALWREAEAAGALSLYKAMSTLHGGCGRAVDVNQPSLLRRLHASALDLSRCDAGLAHAAARAAARDLRRAPPPANRYIFTGSSKPKQVAIAQAVTAIMRDAGAQVSKESGRGNIWKAEMRT